MPGAPVPKRVLTVVSLVVIAVLSVLTAIGVEVERAETRETASGLRVGSLGMQELLAARMSAGLMWFGASPEQTFSSIAGDDGAWAEGSITKRLARVIMLAAQGDNAAALAAFESASQAADAAELGDEAGPVLRVTASILRADALDATARDQLDHWPLPDASDRADAEARLGAFVLLGEALVARDAQARASFDRVGAQCGMALLIFGGWMAMAGLGGLVGAVVLLILLLSGMLRSGTGVGRPESSVLLEVFAVFMVLLLGASLLLELASTKGSPLREWFTQNPSLGIGIQMVIMAASAALALGWWRVRGGSWSSLRSLAGLHMGRGLASTIGLGVTGYALAVILAAAGVLLSILLSALAGEKRMGDPTHPVHEVMQSGRAGTILVLVLAVIMAPLLEETFFRGMLYRGLRDRLATHGAALIAGAFGGIVLSSAVFAMIHPQGLLFAPVLAGLGAGFCVVREWSGSAAPGMIAHALNNGAVLTFTLVITG